MPRHPHHRGNRQLQRLRRLRQQGRRQAAVKGLRRLAIQLPGHPRIAFELGWLAEAQQPETALTWYHRSVYMNPRQADAWYRLGSLYAAQGYFLRAVPAFHACLTLNGEQASARQHLQLAQALDQIQLEHLALPHYLRALELSPENPDIFYALSLNLLKLGDLNLALDSLMMLGRLYPSELAMLSLMMGHLLEKQGEIVAARQCYAEAVQRQPRHLLLKLKKDVAYALVPLNREEIEIAGAAIDTALRQARDRLRHQPLQLPLSQQQILGMLHSDMAYTSYHHLPQLQQRRLYAEVIALATPRATAWRAPVRISRQRIRLGVVVRGKGSSLTYIYAGAMAKQLDPARFEVTVYCGSPHVLQDYSPGGVLNYIGPHLQRQLISREPYEALNQLRAAAPDALYLTEPSWDFHQYLCGLLRAAPVQFTSWMNPGTSGLPTMDYFLSAAEIEPPGAEADYSEQLERWPAFPSWIPRIPPPPPSARADFNLEDGWHLYGCLQNLLKFHPDFDLLIAGILRQDTRGRLLMVTPQGRSRLVSLLMKRFETRIPDVMDRIWVFPELKHREFLQLTQHLNVILDPLYYGGGTTTYEALALGKPLVTLPTDRMVGRISAALSRHIGVEDGITDSFESFITTATAIAADPAWQADIRQRTLASAPQLFEDPQAVACFAEFLERSVARAFG